MHGKWRTAYSMCAAKSCAMRPLSKGWWERFSIKINQLVNYVHLYMKPTNTH